MLFDTVRMKIHRFIGPFDLKKSSIQIREKDFVHQIVRVLKLKTAEKIELCDGAGFEALYEIVETASNMVEILRIEDARKNIAEPERHVVLYAAILKRENFEWAVQKATECGASEIVPIITDRTVKKEVKRERLAQIAKEAAEQSGRGRVPIVEPPMKLKAAMGHAELNGSNHFFHISDSVIPGKAKIPAAAHRVGLFIGPEGGWTKEEAELAEKAGCEIASLGPRVFRGETACAIATFLAVQ